MTAIILRGNALALPLADSTVDLVVTSPPYFGLRSYQDGGEHYSGQIGSEATPAEFVDALIAATREMIRVLKPSGSIWVNLGDKYASGGGLKAQSFADPSSVLTSSRKGKRTSRQLGVPEKSLVGIPWRYAIRCIDDLGLILRAEVIWSKPNGLPESVTDRVRRSHETWFHFTKSPRYFSGIDEVREPHAWQPSSGYKGHGSAPRSVLGQPTHAFGGSAGAPGTANPLGKLPGSVWTIPTQPLRIPESLGVDHFAAFPMEWPRRIIAGWSPAGVCTACGQGRRPVVAKDAMSSQGSTLRTTRGSAELRGINREETRHQRDVIATITGYACACVGPQIDVEIGEYDEAGEYVTHIEQRTDPTWQNPAPTTPGVVLDPFGGTGTTALVADVLGRDSISVDMSADYCRVAEWRTTDPAQRAKAGNVKKKPKKKRRLRMVEDDDRNLFTA